jgi:GNAT superfamily N-acetyltransferase
VLADQSTDLFPVLPGQETLLASWQALSATSRDARLVRSTAAASAVFPDWAALNNAILLSAHDEAATVAQLTRDYRAAGVEAWALWRPSRTADLDAADALGRPGAMVRDITTLVMRASLGPGLHGDVRVVRTSIAAATRATDEPVPVAALGKPERESGLSAWVIVDRQLAVAGTWSFRHERDCGIFTVGTCPGWRRRGLARALVEHVMADAYDDGARTATLQSTPMGQPLYESLGFQAVGRYEEWVSR